ncbi:hypothetical protein D4764_15G0008880 [Takifugu flavidus]|uniref:Uncharacterized protein n=1 Tax=Takifugu flavidus TaxID=433684 RepID=A0A5C6P129_9TELE|nr:hypothetical protein D4764_15G0008880 [Takifugu flavidus]
MHKPPHLAPLNAEEQRLYCELLPDGRASHPISKGEPSHPTEEAHFGRLYPSLFTTTDQCRVLITADAAPIRLSIFCSILPSLVNKTPRYLNSSTWGRISSLTRRRHSTYFQLRTMASDLEVLIFIPAASHAAANRSSDRWRSQADDANRTTSSAKSRDPILRERTARMGGPVGGPYSRRTPHRTPQGTRSNAFSKSTKHVDWLGKLPCTLEDPAEGVELVHRSTPRTKTTLLLLNPKFDYPADPPLQYPRIDLTREAEECDPLIVGTHPPPPS